MRFPFVSRAKYDEAIRDARGALWRLEVAAQGEARAVEAHEYRRQELAAERARYVDLLEKYHALALPSPTLTTVAGAPLMLEPSEPREPSVIAQTIREQCETADGHTDHALARHLRSYARQLKQSGKTDDEIVAKLVAWQSSEPEDNVARMAEAG